MTLKFFKVDDSTIYHDGFLYSFHRILDPAKSSDELQLQQSFRCTLREEENCRSRCHVTGNWEIDRRGRKFMIGFIKNGDHTHGKEYRDTIPKLRFYKSGDDESIHRNGFDYTFYRELDPPKQIADFQWHRTYRCSMSVNGQENCQARIYTTGQWEVNKRELHYQLGIFKNCFHSHGSEQVSREEDKENKGENDTVASALCLTHTKDLDKKEQIRFYKYKGTRVQHSGFFYSAPTEMKNHPKWKCRIRCQRQIDGKRACNGYIWTTGKWEKDDRGRVYQIGIVMAQHDHEPHQIAFQGKDNDDESPEAGLKFYKYIDKKVHRDGHVYYLHTKLTSRPPWKHRMRCTRDNKQLRCNGSIWTTGDWETDELGRVYQRGIPRKGHSHDAFDQFLNEDATTHVGGPMDDKGPNEEDKENRNDIGPCDSSSTHTKNQDNQEQIRFYKHKETGVQHNGFVYSYDQDLKTNAKWKHRMYCNRQINGKQKCTGYIWTTGKWEEDDRKREYQIGIVMNGHGHEPYQISYQPRENNNDNTENGLKFYRMDEKVHRDGHVYSFTENLKNKLWKLTMRCTWRQSGVGKNSQCNGTIWTTGEWEKDSCGRVYQRGIMRGGHCHKTYKHYLFEDHIAHVGDGIPVDDKILLSNPMSFCKLSILQGRVPSFQNVVVQEWNKELQNVQFGFIDKFTLR